jgi:hypothetical protein
LYKNGNCTGTESIGIYSINYINSTLSNGITKCNVNIGWKSYGTNKSIKLSTLRYK